MSIKKTLWNLVMTEGEEQQPTQQYASKFPEATTFPSGDSMTHATTATPPIASAPVPQECTPHMQKIMKMYEDGFASLNRPGIEFFEFFDAVVETGINDPKSYQMAIKILSKSEKTMTKDSLLAQSQYYIDELNKVHASYNAEGARGREKLTLEKNEEGEKLTGDIKLLNTQIESLRNQLQAKELQLAQIHERYKPRINELECKIMANDSAKNRIMGPLETVISGIKTHL